MNATDLNTTPATETRMPTYLPRADVVEGSEALMLYLDLPGVTDSGLDIHFERNTLTVTGTITSPAMEGLEPLFAECSQGRYRRSFVLSDAFDVDKIAAGLKDGVLTIELPKASRQKARKIPIRLS